MTVEEIKQAVDSGKTVCMSDGPDFNPSEETNYIVEKWADGYNIVSQSNGHAIGLTWADNTTLNGKEEEFYVVQR